MTTPDDDLDLYICYRDVIADELCRLAAAGGVAPESLALAVADVPSGTDAGAVGRALWGPFLTPFDVRVGVAVTAFIRRRRERPGEAQKRFLDLCRN